MPVLYRNRPCYLLFPTLHSHCSISHYFLRFQWSEDRFGQKTTCWQRICFWGIYLALSNYIVSHSLVDRIRSGKKNLEKHCHCIIWLKLNLNALCLFMTIQAYNKRLFPSLFALFQWKKWINFASLHIWICSQVRNYQNSLVLQFCILLFSH